MELRVASRKRQGSGFRVQGSGFRVRGLGLRVEGCLEEAAVEGVGHLREHQHVERHRSRLCAGFRVQGSGCRVQGAGCRVQGAGFRVWG